MYSDCITLCLSWFLSFIVSIILHINPDRRYQIIFFCAIKSLVLNMDGTAKFGWGPDWTPWNREVTESSDVSPLPVSSKLSTRGPASVHNTRGSRLRQLISLAMLFTGLGSREWPNLSLCKDQHTVVILL